MKKKNFFAQYKQFTFFLILAVVIILIAVFAPVVSGGVDPLKGSLDEALLAPSKAHIFGTDKMGRDIFARVIYGARASLTATFGVVALIFFIGTTLGVIAGYFGGIVDAVIMRIADVQLSFPSMLIALFIMSVFGRGVGKLLIALTMVGWVTYARTVRGETLSVKKMEYVEAARTIGLPNRIIIIKHVLPNVINSIIVLATIQIGSFILTEATLSFLGVGVPITQPSLGLLVKTGFDVLFSGLWWASVFPGLYIMLIVFGINLLGDFLRDELNPNLK